MFNFIKKLLRKSGNELPNGLKVGKNCDIMGNVSFGSEPYLVELGDKVRIANGVKFFTHDGGAWVLRNLHMLDDADFFGRIKVGNNVHIGADAIIMPGVTIGNNCIIGVRAVVTKDVPDNSIAVGMPAKVVETIEQYYEKHKDTCDFTKHMSADEKKKYLLEKYDIKI